MKKYLLIFLMPLAMLLATACDDGYEPIMEEVDARLDSTIATYYDELASAENGWLANIPTSKGIYRFWMQFTDNNRVTMYTDNLMYPEYRRTGKQSTFRIQGLQRPTLIFDTYSYLAIINDPDPSISGGSADDNQGLETDFEFEIASFDGTTFELLGRRNRVKATLTMATAAEAAAVEQGALMGVQETLQEYMAHEGYDYIELDNDKIAVNFGLHKISLQYVRGSNRVVTVSSDSYVDLDGNIVLSEPLVVKGTIISSFLWNAATKSYSAMSAQRLPVRIQSEAIIGLSAMLGGDKGFTYHSMAFRTTMYNGNISCEIAQLLTKMSRNLSSTSTAWSLGDIYFRFGQEKGKDYIDVEISFGIYLATYTFDILENPNQTTRFTGYDTRHDAVGNADYLLENNCTNDFFNYFVGKTFRKTWLNQMFGSYKMGALVDVADSENYLPGALL